MKRNQLFLLFLSAFVLVPLLCVAVVVIVGSIAPVGTFNPKEKIKAQTRAAYPEQSILTLRAIDAGTQQRSNAIAGSQAETVNAGQAPMLQGATNGTIAAQAGDATVVQGVNTAGAVRVNNLA